MLFEELIKLTILKWRILRMCVGFECIWISSQVPRVVYSLIWDQLLIREVSLGLCGYEIYFLKEAHQRADKVKLVNWCFERKKCYFSILSRSTGPPDPRTQDGNAAAVKADPRREVIENVILKNGCASTGDWTPVFRFPVGCSNHWAIDTTYSEAVWIAVSISPSALQVSD